MESPPQKIGKYDIVEPLGKGAMGVVYKGFDPMIKRHVALKTIHMGFSEPPDDDLAQRFHREAQAAGNLNHPNIVGIYEYGEDAGRAFIAMEYVEGRTLVDLLKQHHPFTLDEIQAILAGILSALDFSHRMGVVHRDIKPGNIMIDTAGAIKVMDFGIARVESSELTQTGTILGTPGYMSPEQLLGEKVDLRSDIYSAGIVLYEMLTGERAFTGASFASVIYKVIHSDLSPPSHLKPTLPGRLDALIARACAKRAEDRYQTAAEFSAALDRILAGQDPVPRPSAAPHPADSPAPPPHEKPAASPARRRRWGLAAAAAAAVACLALGAWFFRPTAPDPAPLALPEAGSAFRDCDTCPEMVVLPAGEFIQGAPVGDPRKEDNESPRRLVAVDYPLAVSRYEITRGEFARFADATGHDGRGCITYDGEWELDPARNWQSPGFRQADTHPATCIAWNDAQAYVRWLSAQTGRDYRLLSASEWEYAAQAGTTPSAADAFHTARACESANVADRTAEADYPGWQVFDCSDRYVHTAPVGSYRANAFGIHDMIGNVFEWVADCWNDNYADAPQDGRAWADGNCKQRVLRGGSWFTAPDYVRVSFRNRFDADYRSSSFGFRVARRL
jgi:formylglycine-generating enzyme required for sulfatase activity/predicted Ser/Thr protein kinase